MSRLSCLTILNTELTWSLFTSFAWFQLAPDPSISISVFTQYRRICQSVIFALLPHSLLQPHPSFPSSSESCLEWSVPVWSADACIRLSSLLSFIPLPWDPYSVIIANLINYLVLEVVTELTYLCFTSNLGISIPTPLTSFLSVRHWITGNINWPLP